MVAAQETFHRSHAEGMLTLTLTRLTLPEGASFYSTASRGLKHKLRMLQHTQECCGSQADVRKMVPQLQCADHQWHSINTLAVLQ